MSGRKGEDADPAAAGEAANHHSWAEMDGQQAPASEADQRKRPVASQRFSRPPRPREPVQQGVAPRKARPEDQQAGEEPPRAAGWLSGPPQRKRAKQRFRQSQEVLAAAPEKPGRKTPQRRQQDSPVMTAKATERMAPHRRGLDWTLIPQDTRPARAPGHRTGSISRVPHPSQGRRFP